MKSIALAVIAAGIFMSAFAENASPAFSLKSVNDSTVTLASLKGKIVVIDFWAMWCAACREAFPGLIGLSKDYASKNVAVVGIDLEKAKPEKVAAFMKKAGITYTVLLDPSSSTAPAFGIRGVPSLAIVNTEGTVVKMFRGMTKETEKAIRQELDALVAATK
jgi:cytochrome c biogenesis protein CcmG, thiol:disulfide interchange protein DsbE